jgi:hypothetical protein
MTHNLDKIVSSEFGLCLHIIQIAQKNNFQNKMLYGWLY